MTASSMFSGTSTGGHIPVLAGPAIEGLRIDPDGVYVDCTAGGGGHSVLMAAALAGGRGRLIALDRDPEAVARAAARLASFPNATVHHRNYGELAQLLDELGVASVHGVLFDFGVSSPQIDDPARGFSLEREGPLDMRMDPTASLTAQAYLRDVSERDLADVLKRYGDVRPAKRIAAAIAQRRQVARMSTTKDLADAVAAALPFVTGVPDETRTVFQAIRIAVNEEFRWLEAGLEQAIAVLAPGGRLVCISFHSGEDRIAKDVLRAASRPRRELMPDGRVLRTIPPCLRIVTPKPLRPSPDEIRVNARAHSARLRIAERLAQEGETT